MLQRTEVPHRIPNPTGEQPLSSPMSPHEFAVQRLDEAGWILLADRLIHGLCHDLNGRAGSISSLVYLLDSGEEPTSVTAILEEESLKLEEAIRLLRLVPDDADEPETLAPGEFLPALARMIPLQRGFEGVHVRLTFPPGAPGHEKRGQHPGGDPGQWPGHGRDGSKKGV